MICSATGSAGPVPPAHRPGRASSSRAGSAIGSSGNIRKNQGKACRITVTAAALMAPGSTVILDGGTTVLAAVRVLQSDLRATVVTHSPTVASSKKIGAASRFAVLPLAGVAGVVTDAGGENAAVRSLGAPLIRA
ncbi:hypothetical protein [Nonomuraea bangladeshensis]|uniref:hypothetical protein n=1 Tax=Nonomuraea bangladeshensis TaxID=404385 RepID=UPI003C2ECE20